jgi:hypothetical protein
MIATKKLCKRPSLLTACLLTGLLMIWPSSAAALKVHFKEGQFTVPNQPSNSFGIAVDESTHLLFVNVTQQLERKIVLLNPDGSTYAPHPELTGGPADFRPLSAAVDNSGGGSAGTIYAADPGGSRTAGGAIQQYNAAADPTAVTIEKVALPADGTPQSGGLPNVVNTGDFGPISIATSPSGDLYVSDRANHAIDVFAPTGSFVSQIGSETIHGGQAPQIAVGPSGEVFAADSGLGLIEFSPSGQCVNACAPIASGTLFAVAVAPSGNVLLSASAETVGGGNESKVLELKPSGAVVSVTGSEEFNHAGPIALDSSTGKLFVVDEESHGFPVRPNIKIFGPLVTLPNVVTQAATNISSAGAEVHGTVDPDGGPDASCAFEYVTANRFAADGFAGASIASCVPVGPFTGEGPNTVHASLMGLNAGTEYKYRLVGTNVSGSIRGPVQSFQTIGPAISSQGFSSPTETSVVLEAVINPHGEATHFWFEYVNQEQFATSEWHTAVKVGGGELPAGPSNVSEAQTLSGLTPGVQYHFRAVAENAGGKAVGEDAVFSTFFPAALSLPDSRAYEQASPVDKNGSNVTGATNVVEAAADGNAVTFYAATGIPGGEGAQNFPIFMAGRTESPAAWTTQGLLPPASTGPRGRIVGWNPELTWSYSGNFAPGEAGTFFARESASRVTAPFAGGLAGVSPGSDQPIPALVATSPHNSVVAFEDIAALAPGAVAGKHNVYLWDRATGRLSLASAMNTGQAPAEGAFGGPFDWYVASARENDGAAELYYPQQTHVLSSDASHLFFTSAADDQIYLRINPTEAQSPVGAQEECTDVNRACTVQVSASQAAIPDPHGEKPAIFNEATPDGRFSLFMSSGKLTDDATTGTADEGRDLYRYDQSTKELVDLTPDTEDANGAEVQGVLGMSDDGSFVYFVANGKLAPGASKGNCTQTIGTCNLYVWHDDATTFIAPVRNGQAFAVSDSADWLPTPNLASHWVEKTARLNSGGNVLLFRSVLRLTNYDNHGHAELYLYDAASGRLRCVSCNPTNLPPTGEAGLQEQPEPFAAPRTKAPVLTRNLSTNGKRVFFDTPDRLVSADRNDVNDVYEWEEPDPTEGDADSCSTTSPSFVASSGGCLFLISGGGEEAGPSYFGDADENGHNVFFFTKQRLVAQDQDVLQDMYDARVGGGIPIQNVVSPAPCEEESCLPAVPGAPSESAPGSTGNVAGGNVKPAKPCREGQKRLRRKGKSVCVKNPVHKKKHHGKKTHHKKPHRHKKAHQKRGGSR